MKDDKNYDRPVGKDEHLWGIWQETAKPKGISWEKFKEDNPHLFANPNRDPNVVHTNDTVHINGGEKTTVKVTFNGYTLTTNPDGNMVLTNQGNGTEVKIEDGTAAEGLANLLMEINPNSKDPEKAKTDKVLKTILDGIFSGPSPDLTKEAVEKQQAVTNAIAKYGDGKPAQPNLEDSSTSVGPYGAPPSSTAPSGGKWVPLLVDGNWKWFDPEVAKAMAAENVAISRLAEAEARPGQSLAQLDVYSLDPEYKGAVNKAKTTLDKVLAPYGASWELPKPKGTLADAQKRLTDQNNLLQNASGARSEYENGQRILLDAIGKQANLPGLSDPNAVAVSANDGSNRQVEHRNAKAAHAEVAGLFTKASLHTARGNKLTIDHMVGTTELELADAKPGSPEHAAIKERLDGLKRLQKAAAGQVTLAEAYDEFGVAQDAAADLAARAEPIKQKLEAEYRSKNPHHFDPNGYTNAAGEYTGKLLKQKIIDKNGQLYLQNTYENDNFLDENNDDTNVLEVALTAPVDGKKYTDDFRNRPLNKEWQALLASTGNTSSVESCTQYATGSQSALAAAKSKILGTQVEQLDTGLKDVKTRIVELTTARDQAMKTHGAGTVEAPTGTLRPGEKPVEITVNGRKLQVAPEVAAAYDKEGPAAIGASGKQVRIEIDGKWLWVHPEVAGAEIDRGLAEDEKNKLEKWEKEIRPGMVAARDWFGFYAGHPKLLDYGSEEHEARLKYSYFNDHKEQALAGYQVQFQQLYDNGQTGDFKKYKPGELNGVVARTLGLDDEGAKKVTDEIVDRAGETPEVKVVPIFSLDGGTEASTALFAIKSGGKEIGYVDTSGKYYGSFDEFQHENRIFSEKGKLVMAKGGDMTRGADGSFSLDDLEVADARKVDFSDRATDIGLGIVAGGATILSIVAPPTAPIAMPVAYTAGGLLTAKVVYKEGEHLLQGGDFDDQSFWNVMTAAATALPLGASGIRYFGLTKAGMSTSKAFAGSLGLARMKDSGVMSFGRYGQSLPSAQELGTAMQTVRSAPGAMKWVGWGLDAGGFVAGVPLVLKTGQDLIEHGGEMSLGELANAVIGLGAGTFGTGVGARGMLHNFPTKPGSQSGEGTPSGTGDFPAPRPALEPGPSSRPRVVYEAGSDGIYRSTGKQVIPDPNEVVIEGEVVSVREGADDGGPTTQTGRNPAHDAGGSGKPQPADDDVISVPRMPDNDAGSVRLIWDPSTRTFTGMPERTTGEYTYTSGKDPKPKSPYLDGLTPEQMLARYEKEKAYYSSRELAERYGPDGVQIPPKPLREKLPDFRVTAVIRLRVNTGEFGIGSPTTHAAAFGIGTKADLRNIGWSIVDSFSQRSTLPFRHAASNELMFTGRFREYLNITGLQAGLSPYSNQTIFPVRGTKLLKTGETAIFKDAPGYKVKPRSARIVGDLPDGSGKVVEMTYSLNLDAEPVVLTHGQRDFFGVTADNAAGFVRLKGPLPYDRVMTETKITPRVAVLANIPAVDRLVPRVGFEKRPEMGLKDTPSTGDIVSRQFFDQNQAMFDRVTLKIQFAVSDPNKAARFVEGIKGGMTNRSIETSAAQGEASPGGLLYSSGKDAAPFASGTVDPIAAIRAMVANGQIDPSKIVSYVPNPLRSGLRLSAVSGKPASEEIVLLTGEKRRVTHPDQSYLDLQLNDSTMLPGILAFNPDRFATSLTYRVKTKFQAMLPEQFQSRPPQARQMPTDGNIYRNFYGPGGDNPSTRYTIYFGTPNLRLGPIALSGEVQFQYKTKAGKTAPAVANKDTATLAFERDGQTDTLIVPAWLARAIETASAGSSAVIPKGGKASLDGFLGDLQKARPDSTAAIEQFRGEYGPVIADGKFLRADAAGGVLQFLSTQAGGDGPVTPRNAAPRQSPEEQGVTNTSSHIPSSAKPLTQAEIAANRQEASRMLGEMVPQDLGMPEMTLADLADQFSRSPTLMGLLRGAHAKGVRIVNPARQDLRIFDTSMEHDLTATGSQYDGPLKVISVDADMFRSPEAGRSHDVVTGEFVDMLAHELSHVTDPSTLPAPKDFQDWQIYVDAFVGANLNNEGRARFVQYAVAGELSANGGKPAPVLSAESNSADSAVYARYEAGEIDRSQAIQEMSALFKDKEPSTVPNGTYQDFYTQQAEAVARPWYHPANGLDGLNTGARVLAVNHESPALGDAAGLQIVRLAPHGRGIGSLKSRGSFDRIIVGKDVIASDALKRQMDASLRTMADLLKPGGQIHLTGIGNEKVLKTVVKRIPGLELTEISGSGSDRYFRITRAGPASDGDALTGQTQVSGIGNARRPGKPGPSSASGQQPAPQNQPPQSPGINLTRNQLQAITGNRVGQIDVSAFNPKQVPWLTRKQMGKLTTKQLQDLSEAGLHIYLTKPQIRAIPDTKIQYLNVAGFDARQIPWLTEKHIENLTKQQFIDLNKAGLQARFTKAQLQAVPDTRIGLLDVTGLEGKQVPWLTRKQIAAMSDKQFQELGDAGLLKYLTKAQVPEARIEALDVAKLDPKQVPWLTGDQVGALTREQWGAFTIHHIEALTQPQVEAITPKQFEEMSPGQFRKFTPEQFEWMSMEQRNALSVLQLTTFRATHKKAMTPDQKVAVNEALSHARMRENAQAIATFGSMSGTSYALWSALPPHWSATASAVAFGVRGAVFGTQALFPNATANHKPFGRFLNGLAGATFVAAAPGAATGLIGGKEVIVNSSFTLGNIVYGTKSMLQSFTGRPVIRNLAEHLAGPGYVLGCAVYTVNSWPSPIATTAGTLFTFGCAEFWASARRTDNLNRRPVPRTDEDIAKQEKSDKRWTMADRWSLGITFGIGMFLFSLDSLLAEPWNTASDPAGSDPVKPGDDTAQPPDDTPDTPPEKEIPPEDFPQLVVVADDGLNLREKPAINSERIVVLEPGTFVDQTGKPAETSGKVWIPVEGYGPDGDKEKGWVAGEFVKTHPEGASNSEGRVNPALEQRGYRWVEARQGDRIRAIANANSADVAETVVLNMDHILSPDVIFPGDRIYLPG